MRINIHRENNQTGNKRAPTFKEQVRRMKRARK